MYIHKLVSFRIFVDLFVKVYPRCFDSKPREPRIRRMKPSRPQGVPGYTRQMRPSKPQGVPWCAPGAQKERASRSQVHQKHWCTQSARKKDPGTHQVRKKSAQVRPKCTKVGPIGP